MWIVDVGVGVDVDVGGCGCAVRNPYGRQPGSRDGRRCACGGGHASFVLTPFGHMVSEMSSMTNRRSLPAGFDDRLEDFEDEFTTTAERPRLSIRESRTDFEDEATTTAERPRLSMV